MRVKTSQIIGKSTVASTAFSLKTKEHQSSALLDFCDRESTNDQSFLSHRASKAWWRHQMETCSALPAICAGNSPIPGEFPAQRPVTRSFDVFFDLRPNKRLSKQSWRWWFETLFRPLWRYCNEAQSVLTSPCVLWARFYETVLKMADTAFII